jgi:cell division topological specificity factor
MASFLNRIFGGRRSSSEVAKERLQLVLVHDRSDLTPEQVQSMKEEILEVIARYVDFDREAVEINLMSQNRDSILHAEIPIKPSTRRRRVTPTSASAYTGDA